MHKHINLSIPSHLLTSLKGFRIFYQLMQLSNIKMCFLSLYMLYAPGSTLTGCNTWLPIASATDARPSATGTVAPRSVYCPSSTYIPSTPSMSSVPQFPSPACNLRAFIVRHLRATRHRATPAGILRYSPAAEGIRLAGLFCSSAIVHPTDTNTERNVYSLFIVWHKLPFRPMAKLTC